MDQIFTLHEILASRRERRSHTFMAFLDARHAYDRVWRDGLLYRLVQCGVNGRMLRFLNSMLSATNRHVAAHGTRSAEFTTTVGLPQGAVLSPLLYAIFINALVDDLKARKLGVDVFGRKVGILLYADDIVLIAESAERCKRCWTAHRSTRPGGSSDSTQRLASLMWWSCRLMQLEITNFAWVTACYMFQSSTSIWASKWGRLGKGAGTATWSELGGRPWGRCTP
jgi:Reverse transcriptase (RNA-dependent DNA polymerase)